MVLKTFKNANLALMFILEMCVLATALYWGIHTGPNLLAKIGLGIGAPALAAVIWGILGAPTSPRRLKGNWYLLLKVIFFGTAALALYLLGDQLLGIIFALVFVVNSILIIIWKQS